MKTLIQNILVLSILGGFLGLTACTPKEDPRWTNEPAAKAWKYTVTTDNEDVPDAAFSAFDTDKAYAQISKDYALQIANQEVTDDLTASILKPLHDIVLNKKFIGAPKYQGLRMSILVNVFNRAFQIEWKKKSRSKDFAAMEVDYYNTVFDGCTRDMGHDQCVNAKLFASDGFHTSNMTLLASELDQPIADLLVKFNKSSQRCINESNECRYDVEERYRRLSMGVYKLNRNGDQDFAFAYMKYARMFALFLDYAKMNIPTTGPNDNSMSYSLLAQVHGQIFEILVGTYKPKDIHSQELRDFVNDFNPWAFSHKESDVFQFGTTTMLQIGSSCCLYQDDKKTTLNPVVLQTINDTQLSNDSFGLSFTDVIADIRKDYGDRLFVKMKMMDVINQFDANHKSILATGKNDGSFFNEYFFIVDRLFRGHLQSGEVASVLDNTNPDKTLSQFPKMIEAYMKVYLIYMVVETNRFMSEIYHSDLAADQVFEQAVQRSRELSSRWGTIQSQLDLLNKLEESYFKEKLRSSPEYENTFKLLAAVNRNIHYLSVYPNMIVLNYYLAKMKGKVTINSWFGSFDIDADTVNQEFFDGVTHDPWFHFGKDVQPMNRLTLLYGLEYLLSTESINTFVAKDSVGTENDRSKFFEMIFDKYLGQTVSQLQVDFSDYKNSYSSNGDFAAVQSICAYEMGTSTAAPQKVSIDFMKLDTYTYTGVGDAGLNSALSKYLTGAGTAIDKFYTDVDQRRTFVRAMIDIIEADLIRNKPGYKKNDHDPDLDRAREIVNSLDDIQNQFTKEFTAKNKDLFKCAITLREIERRRANRLYDEERFRLGQIFDKMVPMFGVTDLAQLNSLSDGINATFFQKDTYGMPYQPLDHVDGLNYRMAKYDLFARMKQRIESDIFTNVSWNELAKYPNDYAAYIKPRKVGVDLTFDMTQDPLYKDGKTNAKTITMKGTSPDDRNDFIRQGLLVLGGKDAFLKWNVQMQGDTLFENYLTMLEKFYLLPSPVKVDATIKNITAQDLSDTYLDVVSTYMMDPYDVYYSAIFRSFGRHDKNFYVNKLLENDGTYRLPLYYGLMNDVYALSHVDVSYDGPVAEAFTYAEQYNTFQDSSSKTDNSMQAFIFEPSHSNDNPGTVVPQTFASTDVRSQVVGYAVWIYYGNHANERFKKVNDLFSLLQAKEDKTNDLLELNSRLNQPLYLELDQSQEQNPDPKTNKDQYFTWYTPGKIPGRTVIDSQPIQNFTYQLNQFIQHSNNMYGTRDLFPIGAQ